MLLKELNYINDKDSYWLGQLIYLSMIDEHIISVELGSISFNVTCGFNTKAHSSKGEVLMDWIFEMNDIMVKKA